MIVLGFSGKARSGKSTLCRALFDEAEKNGWAVIPAPFAGPLKREMAEKHGYDDVHVFKTEKPDTYRYECQHGGAEARAKDPDHWVNKWLAEFEEVVKLEHSEKNETNLPFLLLVDDVRYENELELLNKKGALTFFVKHGEREIEDPDGEWRQHESENLANAYEDTDNEILKEHYDYVINNGADEKYIEAWAKEMINLISDSNFCKCEACTSVIERRQFDVRKLIDEAMDELDKEKEEGDE